MLQNSPTTYEKARRPRAKSLDSQEREELITNHLSKVKYIAERMAAKLPPSVEKDDLYGAGVIGLLDAVDRFEPSRGIAFTTFAEMRVRGSIIDSLRALDWASRSTRKRAREVQDAFARVEQKLGRYATEEEVAEHLGIPIADLQKTLMDIRGLSLRNLDEREEESGISLVDTIASDDLTPFESFEENELRALITDLIKKLPEKEKTVISLYYLDELNMKEIGQVLSVSESRVSQLRTQAILRLRGGIRKRI